LLVEPDVGELVEEPQALSMATSRNKVASALKRLIFRVVMRNMIFLTFFGSISPRGRVLGTHGALRGAFATRRMYCSESSWCKASAHLQNYPFSLPISTGVRAARLRSFAQRSG